MRASRRVSVGLQTRSSKDAFAEKISMSDLGAESEGVMGLVIGYGNAVFETPRRPLIQIDVGNVALRFVRHLDVHAFEKPRIVELLSSQVDPAVIHRVALGEPEVASNVIQRGLVVAEDLHSGDLLAHALLDIEAYFDSAASRNVLRGRSNLDVVESLLPVLGHDATASDADPI